MEKNNFFEKKLNFFRNIFTFSKNFSQDFQIFQLKSTFFIKTPQNIFSQLLSRFFSSRFFFWENIFSPISIRNFPRIPKITLRKSCDEFKASKNKKSTFFYNVYPIYGTLWYMLCITTLNSNIFDF